MGAARGTRASGAFSGMIGAGCSGVMFLIAASWRGLPASLSAEARRGVFLGRHIHHLVGRLGLRSSWLRSSCRRRTTVAGGFQVDVGDQQDGDLVPQLDGLNVGALFVEQEGGDIHRHLDVHRGGVFLHGFLFEDAQDVQGGGFRRADVAGAGAARAGM